MEKQEIFIFTIIFILVIIRFINFTFADFFDNTIHSHPNINYFPCDKHPNNSNCTCPPNMKQQIIYKDFPIGYGMDSPYDYTCVNSSIPEPSTNLFNNS